jgi:hypothetical protein
LSVCATCGLCTSQPTQYQLVVANIAEGTCGDCASLNGTFTLDCTSRPCYWLYAFPTSLCSGAHGSYQIVMAESIVDGNTYLNAVVDTAATVPGTNTKIPWRKQKATSGGSFNCSAVSSESLTRSINLSNCDYNTSTAVVTAL